jgi:hypothetical protein
MADAASRANERLSIVETDAMVLSIVSDLNNIVEAIEDQGDRAFFGSTNDADRLKEIARMLDDWRFERGSVSA